MAKDTGVSFDISGEDVVEVRSSPALEAADNLEALKAEGAKLVAAKDWRGALDQYEKVVVACEACKDTLSGDFEAERSAEKAKNTATIADAQAASVATEKAGAQM